MDLANPDRAEAKNMKICKYCGKDHSHIGMTIIPSCVDVLIDKQREEIKQLREAYEAEKTLRGMYWDEKNRAQDELLLMRAGREQDNFEYKEALAKLCQPEQ